ncbi:PREDICTED: uncharacterized protein LOC104595815 [Nelumbo nucifera]|uniref:Uncharacterized protein LOC104595815 n=1 Tax=Nelumbo nucifera TaxID=4432 RepID=A0A1U8A0D7_NELNU|nr:PREDICTED: uncharacterized protein LOC104595815 [Nelumbo nucifera]
MAVPSSLLRSSNPRRFILPSSLNLNSHPPTSLWCLSKAGANGHKGISNNGERKSKVATKASTASESVVSSQPQTSSGAHLSSMVADVKLVLFRILEPAVKVKRKSWKLQAEMLIEKVILDCRFFSLLAVMGSLVGSILCFVEGCFLVLESYFQYFYNMSKKADEGHVINLLIEAIDMFIVGTAMLTLGVGLYALFVGTNNMKKGNGALLSGSNLFGLFRLKMLPAWMEIHCISQAKSRIGHAVLMMLQVGVLEKFKSVPLVTPVDLACFAGAVLVSSACIFVLSRLSMGGTDGR